MSNISCASQVLYIIFLLTKIYISQNLTMLWTRPWSILSSYTCSKPDKAITEPVLNGVGLPDPLPSLDGIRILLLCLMLFLPFSWSNEMLGWYHFIWLCFSFDRQRDRCMVGEAGILAPLDLKFVIVSKGDGNMVGEACILFIQISHNFPLIKDYILVNNS